MTFEEALEKAKKVKSHIDNCTEYTDAFVFGWQGDDDEIGGSGPVVILKATGEAINMTAYLDNTQGKYVGEHPVGDEAEEEAVDYLAQETEEKFFADLRQMERENLIRMGDAEALAILDQEQAELDAEAERLDAQDDM